MIRIFADFQVSNSDIGEIPLSLNLLSGPNRNREITSGTAKLRLLSPTSFSNRYFDPLNCLKGPKIGRIHNNTGIYIHNK